MKKLHVAISGISASDNPAPGTGVARSLLEDMEIDYHLAGLAYDALEPGIYMDWLFERSFMVPYPTASQEALIQRLLYIRHHFGLDVAVPTLDSELPFYINNEEKLREQGIHTFLPTQEQFRLRGKEYLSDVAQKSGISAPQQQLVTRQDELIKAVGELGLPVMIKGTLYKAYAAHTLDSALALFGKIAAEWGFPVIVQQLVHGEEMNVIGVGDGEGGLVGMVAARKMSVTELGKIWTGVTVTHPAWQQQQKVLSLPLSGAGHSRWNVSLLATRFSLLKSIPASPPGSILLLGWVSTCPLCWCDWHRERRWSPRWIIPPANCLCDIPPSRWVI